MAAGIKIGHDKKKDIKRYTVKALWQGKQLAASWGVTSLATWDAVHWDHISLPSYRQ